ncbi:CKLF-like MARVEL transmembrane domain-containing protein 2B-like protein, partial [Cricetulus griseus]
ILMVISAILALVDLYLQKKHLKGKKIPKSAVGHRILSVLMETITKEEEMRIRKANEEFENEEKERRRREKKK